MKKKPPQMSLLERWYRGPAREHVLGDIAEEYHRLRGRSRILAECWLLRQTIGAIVQRRVARSRTPMAVFAETWLKDLSFGIRVLLRDRLITTTVVATLGLGIGATATMYSITRGLLRELPFEDPERIVSVGVVDRQRSVISQDVPLVDMEDWRRIQQTMTDIAGVARRTFHVTRGNAMPVRVEGAAISPWAFELLGVNPQIGTTFRETEVVTGASTVILGYNLWRELYAASPDAIGATLRVDGELRTVIAVMPDGFGFPRSENIWIPITTSSPSMLTSGPMPVATVFGRLAPGVSIVEATAEFASLGRPSLAMRPAPSRSETIEVEPFTHRFIGGDANALLYTMLAIVSSVLLIACVNVTNLLLAQAAVRAREMAVRVALGCSRGRLLRQLLTETVITAALGSALGVLLAFVAVAWFNATLEHRIDFFWVEFSVDEMVLGFVTFLTVATTILVGVVPSARATRVDVAQTLKEGRGTVSSLRMGRITRGLVVAEIAVSMVLLVASGLMVRGVLGLSARNLRFDVTNVVTARARLAAFDYPGDSSLIEFYGDVQRAWSGAHNGEVVLTSILPGRQTGNWSFDIEGVVFDDFTEQPSAPLRLVSNNFFDEYGMLPISGRVFDARDVPSATPVVVVNRAFAERWFDSDPIGRRIRVESLGPNESWRDIVGVVDDLGANVSEGRPVPGVFVPIGQSPRQIVRLSVHHTGTSADVTAESLRSVVATVDPNLPLYEAATLEDVLANEISPQRTFAILFGVFGVLALVLATVGLYGTVAFMVLQRQREFGVRRALGAKTSHLAFSVARAVGKQLGVGLGVGVALAVLVAPLLGDFTFGANPRDPLVFGSVIMALSFAAVLASAIPTRRAARVDPMFVLRDE